MKLKITKVQELQNALGQLDGIDKAVRVDEKDRIIRQPFQLSGRARWNIAKNVRILSDRIEAFSQVRNDLIKQISGGKNIIEKNETEKMEAFQKEITSVLETEEEVDGLLTISREDLNLDQNPIPTWVIVALAPLITE